MLHHLLTEGATSGSFPAYLGSLLTGISELLLALGAGIGFLIRYKQNARKAEQQQRDVANRAAAEAAKRLDKQYAERVEQFEETINRMQAAFDNQQRMYEEKLTNLQALNTRLVNQILKLNEGKQQS